MMKKVCCFGSFDPNYSRNILTRKAFMNLGFMVVDCHDNLNGFKHYINLVHCYIRSGWKCDFIFIPVLGHFDVPLAWFLGKISGKKVIFDAFYSVYDSYVLDRKSVKPSSFAGLRFYFYDLLSMSLAEKVILDTEENIEFVIKKYRIKREKFYELPVTADPDIFKPIKRAPLRTFTVGFYGSYMPLHGIEVIVDAINELRREKIKFLLLGSGPGLEDTKKRIKKMKLDKKVSFLPNVPYRDLPSFFKIINLSLAGPFGDTPKADRVLPTKAVESLSCNFPTIILETPTTKRLLKGYKGQIFWLNKRSGLSLADKILKTKEKLGKRQSYKNYFNSSGLTFGDFTRRLEKIIE